MKLRNKISLVFVVGLTVFGVTSYKLLVAGDDLKMLTRAELIMNFANATRAFTTEEVQPHHASERTEKILLHTIPSFAATQTLKRLRKTIDFKYREVAFMPTNKNNKPTDWELQLLKRLSASGATGKESGKQKIEGQEFVYLARAIRMNNPKCLTCHGRAATVPRLMAERYGQNNGVDWKLNEVVAAQVSFVPVEANAPVITKRFIAYMLLVASFLLIFMFYVEHIANRSAGKLRRRIFG